MLRRLEACLVLGLLVVTAARAQPPDDKSTDGALPGFAGGKSKEPITITANNLEYNYKDGIIVYRGEVIAIQGEVKVRSDELHITLMKSDDPKAAKSGPDLSDTSASKLQQVIATGSVRIDQGTRWAVGGKATFEQGDRTLVLTENPVLHDGPNVLTGDRVIVYLDKNQSIVEGGNKRVKGTFYPKDDKDQAGKTAAATHEAAAQ
jgi:lipopolysaccharide export system protein LptA